MKLSALTKLIPCSEPAWLCRHRKPTFDIVLRRPGDRGGGVTINSESRSRLLLLQRGVDTPLCRRHSLQNEMSGDRLEIRSGHDQSKHSVSFFLSPFLRVLLSCIGWIILPMSKIVAGLQL